MNINILKLKTLAEAAQRDQHDYTALNDYGMAVTPTTVLELIVEIERHRQVDAEGYKPEISNLFIDMPCAAAAVGHGLDKAEGETPDNTITPPCVATQIVSSMEIALAEFLRGKMQRLRNSYTLAFEAGWNARDAALRAALPQDKAALHEDIERGNRIQLAMALEISTIAQAIGFDPEEQPGGEGIATAIRVLRAQLAYLGKHLWGLLELYELSPSVREKVEAALSGAADPRKLSAAACDVLGERHRQEEVEGWHHDHDDAQNACEMAVAAALYALYSDCHPKAGEPPKGWPWDPSWWKPKNYRADLVRAGALILAEIERLDRQQVREAHP